ncbi:MAG: DUF2723 domain-containing protein, partial [Bdellovibrionales bacterium]|nr:DUF2723 domain-containing protein [Bdellovibrionales bacterium]
MQKEASKKSSALLSDTLLRSRTLWAFLIPFFIYFFTAPHSVTFEDSGLFILASYYWGIPHPPGYPLYTMLSHFFTWLPFGEVAFRVSLFSVVCGALGSVFCYLIYKRLSERPILALLAALVVAFSATMWSQMIVAEVYPLNYFLCLMFLYGCLYIADHPSEK